MPLTRYRVRSEYGLADPELYRAADKDDPEALLEGVAMAGLVGVLRQLGDLAEFAAEIFHDLHEEVLVTAARGHGLIVRVQQLEAEFPPIEKALLAQTTQSSFHYNAGVDWHPNLRSEQNLIARGDLPRFVMDSYEESRGPPRLFLLDKFDVAGAGACLKRYTDPSFFKQEAAASGKENVEIPREKKNRRVKRKGLRWRNGETTPEVVPASHAKLQQLFFEERIENGHSDPARLVKLKRKHLNGSVIDPGTGKSYMEKFVETPKEHKLACETSIVPVSFTQDTRESGIRILEISTASPSEKSLSDSAFSSPNVHEDVSKSSTNGYGDEVGDAEIIKVVPDTSVNDETSERSPSLNGVQVERHLAICGEGKPKGTVNGYESDDVASEVDNYMDAVASMESEIETDSEYRPNRAMRFLKAENHGTDSEANEEQIECRTQLSDSQSVGNFSTSDDGNNSFKRNRSSFSYSDSPSSLVENAPVDSDQGAKTFPSAEIMDDPSNELGATPHKLVVSSNTSFKEEKIPAREEPGSSGLVSDLDSTQLHGDPEASSLEDITTKLVDVVATEPRVSSQISEDITKTSGRYLVDESEAEYPNVASDAVQHKPNVSELASEDEDSSANEDFEMKEEFEVSNKCLGSHENEQQSVSHEHLCSSLLPDSEASLSRSAPPNDFPASRDHSDVSEPGGGGVHREDLSAATLLAQKSHMPEDIHQEESLQTNPGIKEPHLPDFSEDIPHVEPVSAETNALFSKKSANSEDSLVENFEEAGASTNHGAICSPSETTTLQEPLIDQKEAECHDGVSLDCKVESETFGESRDLELDSADLGSLSTSIPTSYRHSSPDIRNNKDSLPAENTQNSFPVVDITETAASLDAKDQESESAPSNHFNNIEAIAECPVIDEARSQVHSDQLDVDHLEVDQTSEQITFQKDASLESPREEDLPGHQSSTPEFSSNPFESATPNVASLPEPAQVDLAEMPPLPPLPPMQWRMGLGTGMGMGMGIFQNTSLEGNQGFFPPIQPSLAGEKSEVESPQNPLFPLPVGEDEKPLHVVAESAVVTDASGQSDPISPAPMISSERHEHGHLAVEEEKEEEEEASQSASSTQNHDDSEVGPETGSDATKDQQQSLRSPDREERESSVVTPAADEQVPLGLLMPIGDTRWSSNKSRVVSESQAEKENGNPVPKAPRPRNPLIDAVNAHGTSKLRKVAERIRPQLGPKADERDSLLEQIRTKSFSLKPTMATRPSMGPTFNKTNLKVAAILEKANAIRQALAGSDDEDDEDNWE